MAASDPSELGDARRLLGKSASAFYLDAPRSLTFLRSFSARAITSMGHRIAASMTKAGFA